MVQFSTPTKVVTITATVNVNGTRSEWGGQVTDRDIQREAESSLRALARSNGVTVESIEVTVADGPRTVTLTEEEYNALRQGGQSGE